MVSNSKVLVMEFLTEDNDIHSLIINPPKDNLSKEEVTEAMNAVVESEAFLTSAGRHLVDVNNAYYKITTIEELEFASQGE